MKKLASCEVYQHTYGRSNTEIQRGIRDKLSIGTGVIAPTQIEATLVNLRNKSKSNFFRMLPEALALFENRGLIRLFNLSGSDGSRSGIPASMPLFPSIARNRYKEMDNSSNGVDHVMFVNMYRVGHWSADSSEYLGLDMSSLYASLESGVIGYKLIIQHMADSVFSNKSVLEYLIKVYTYMFSLTITKTKTSYGGSEFQEDAARFLIARFLLLNILEKQDSDIVDDYAYLAVQHRSSLSALKSFEEISMINYDKLSTFLKTFGEAFYNGEGIDLSSFETKWTQLFGDSTALAIEYVPYLLHFLFAVENQAPLGGAFRLLKQKPQLTKNGLPLLYNAVINALK